MDEEANTLLIDVRASTQGFQSDIDKMRSAVDTTSWARMWRSNDTANVSYTVSDGKRRASWNDRPRP